MSAAELVSERQALIGRLAEIQTALLREGGPVEPVVLPASVGGEAKAEWCHLPASNRWAARLVQGAIVQIIGTYDTLTEAVDATNRWREEMAR